MSRPVITDAHLQALERPPPAVWDRMPGYARQRWLRRHKAALRAPASGPDMQAVPAAVDTPLTDQVVAYLEAAADHPRPLSQTQAARDLGITRDALRGALTRAGRQDLLDRLKHTRGGAG